MIRCWQVILMLMVPAMAEDHLVLIKAGDYQVGEKRHGLNPLRTVRVEAFRIADAETTNRQFAKFVEATGYKTDAEKRGFGMVFREGMGEWKWDECTGAHWRLPFGPDGRKAADLPDHPVTQISGADARAYCKWAGGRLPTLVEWEVAARAGSKDKFPWGAELDVIKTNIWNGKTHGKNTKEDGFVYTAPVRSFPANAWGLYDVVGNVFEYCEDLPRGTKDSSRARLIAARGGSWWCSARTCHFYNLVDIGTMDVHGSLPNQGFRVAFAVSR